MLEYVVGRLESREVLKKLFWMSKLGRFRLSEVELVVVDRFAVGGMRTVRLSNDAILAEDRIILLDADAQIPIHRVIEIRAGGETLWRKGQSVRTKN